MLISNGTNYIAGFLDKIIEEAKSPDYRAVALLAGLTFISRLFFLSAGYGSVNDAWRVATAARRISATRHYWASRLPPHPVQEILDSFLWGGGPWVLNAITALFSVMAVVFFALSLRALGFRSYFWGGVAVAFTPVIYVNSTTSTDYVWALAFILASLYFVLKLRPGVAGVLLGLAIGSRITSGAMLLPLSLLLAQRLPARARGRALLVFSIVTIVVGGIAFIPVFDAYGLSFFTYSAANPTLLEIAKTATIFTWGGLGCLAIVLACVCALLGRTRVDQVAWTDVAIWSVAIILYATAFMMLPDQPGYLVPLIPFVILVFVSLLRQPAFAAFCLLLASASFVAFNSGGVIPGPIISDHRSRLEDVAQLGRILQASQSLPPNTVIVAGHWFPKLELYLPDRATAGLISHRSGDGSEDGEAGVTWVRLLGTQELTAVKSTGNRLMYLPDQAGFEFQEEGVDLDAEGAIQLRY